MNIVIRADGGEGIGLGHVVRTMVLAKELRKKYNVSYICSDDNRYIKGIELIESNDFKVHKINSIYEIDEINNINRNLIIVDKYNIDDNYLTELRKKSKVMYIDDNNDLDIYDVDILLNHNIYGEKIKYKTKSETVKLLGSKYTLIREEFKNFNKKKHNNNKLNILITVGGSDDFNLTEIILNQLEQYDFNKHIVIGPAFIHYNKLKQRNNINEFFYKNANMPELMCKMDLAISASGSTLYELNYLRVPTIAFVLAENQINIYKYMSENNLIIPSNIDNIYRDVEKVIFHCNNLKVNSVIDGYGVNEIEKVITRIIMREL